MYSVHQKRLVTLHHLQERPALHSVWRKYRASFAQMVLDFFIGVISWFQRSSPQRCATPLRHGFILHTPPPSYPCAFQTPALHALHTRTRAAACACRP